MSRIRIHLGIVLLTALLTVVLFNGSNSGRAAAADPVAARPLNVVVIVADDECEYDGANRLEGVKIMHFEAKAISPRTACDVGRLLAIRSD